MKVEKLKILADDLGLEDKVDKIITAYKHICGDYCFTKKGKLSDKEEYTPIYNELHAEIHKRLNIILNPNFTNWKWTFGRLSDGSCYITLYNPEYD